MGAPVVDGERYVIGDNPSAVLGSASVFWLREHIGETPEVRAQYARMAEEDHFWVHMDADAAHTALREHQRLEAAYGDGRSGDSKIWRVRVLIEEVDAP